MGQGLMEEVPLSPLEETKQNEQKFGNADISVDRELQFSLRKSPFYQN